MKNIGRHFGTQIFDPLYEHVCKGHRCMQLFSQLIDAYCENEREKMNAIAKDIDATESQADAIKYEIRHNITHSIFATVRRSYILNIIRHQDKICDRTEDAANLICMRNTSLPKKCIPPLRILTGKAQKTVTALYDCIHEIISRENERNKTYEEVINSLDSVHALERETDDALHDFSTILFQNEDKTDAVSLMLLFEITRMISHIADAAENAAHAYSAMLNQN